MDVISRACFGSNYLKGKEIFSRLGHLQKVMSKTSLFIRIPGLRHLPTKTNREIWRLDQEIHSLVLNIARERKESPPNSSAKDLLQSIVDSAGTGPDVADDFIVDNCKSIYFAGHETTALSATWCLMLLGIHPEWQDRARAEVINVCHGQMPDADMLNKMKVVDMVIIPATIWHTGVLPRHVATIAKLKPGVLSVHEGNDVAKYFINSGFVFIHANSFADIVDVEAVPLDHIDPSLVQKGLADFTQKLNSISTDLEKAEAQIRVDVHSALNTALTG